MDPVCAWLIEQEPWVRFGTRVDLMGCSGPDARAAADREAMVSHPRVQAVVHELKSWPGQPLRSHRSSGHLIHKLTFLADLGITAHYRGMEDVVDRIMAHRCRTGPFQIMTDIPERFGGTGEIAPAWALCGAPWFATPL